MGVNASSGSAVVEHFTHNPKVEDSNPTTEPVRDPLTEE
jgi:hypothetical protein